MDFRQIDRDLQVEFARKKIFTEGKSRILYREWLEKYYY